MYAARSWKTSRGAFRSAASLAFPVSMHCFESYILDTSARIHTLIVLLETKRFDAQAWISIVIVKP